MSISNHARLAFQEYLYELKNICGINEVLPKSHTLSSPPPSDSGPVRLETSKIRIQRKNAPQRRPPDIQDRAFLMTFSSCLGLKDPQAFHQMAVMWKNLDHTNVVPLLGVTIHPIQLVSGWMPDTDLTGYITNHRGQMPTD